MKYLFIKNGNLEGFYGPEGGVEIIDDPVKLFREGKFNDATDNLYQIGNELKLKVVLEPVSATRKSSFRGATELNTRGLKSDDLGVGDYRG